MVTFCYSIGEVRQKYQDLVQEQQRAAELLDERMANIDIIEDNQICRLDTLGHCNYLLSHLQNPMPLDQAKELIRENRTKTVVIIIIYILS